MILLDARPSLTYNCLAPKKHICMFHCKENFTNISTQGSKAMPKNFCSFTSKISSTTHFFKARLNFPQNPLMMFGTSSTIFSTLSHSAFIFYSSTSGIKGSHARRNKSRLEENRGYRKKSSQPGISKQMKFNRLQNSDLKTTWKWFSLGAHVNTEL